MTVFATIIEAATGQSVQTMKFGRMPRVGASFTLESGKLVSAQRIEVGKPAPGKFVSPVTVWVAPARSDRQP